MPKNDTLKSLTESVVGFRDRRNWKQFHNTKDMALSLSLEVAELLELMQWRNGDDLDTHLSKHLRDVGEELSDILYWTLLIAHDLEVDLNSAFRKKMVDNEAKYPETTARNSCKKYDQLDSNPEP